MAADSSSSNTTQSLSRLRLIIWLAVASVTVSAVAGVVLLVLEPEAGSSTEAALGIAAAIGGIATGALVIVALIYAQVKNLWRLAPLGIRIVLWVFIVVGVAFTLWNLVSQPFRA
jgi:hypothetical protein